MKRRTFVAGVAGDRRSLPLSAAAAAAAPTHVGRVVGRRLAAVKGGTLNILS